MKKKEFDLVVRPSEMFLYKLNIRNRILREDIRNDYVHDYSFYQDEICDYYDIDLEEVDDNIYYTIRIKAVSSASVNYFEYLTEEEKDKYCQMVKEED
ncbi:hypothetical protein [Klebsiella pneumoniae]|uniref:hypothetical protein n=1 Tax=Klebsiella pneumoniae TaxID=573 RepID=UPI00132FD41A|nr:hypothetical protein [Klebsiella pneumoniae]